MHVCLVLQYEAVPFHLCSLWFWCVVPSSIFIFFLWWCSHFISNFLSVDCTKLKCSRSFFWCIHFSLRFPICRLEKIIGQSMLTRMVGGMWDTTCENGDSKILWRSCVTRCLFYLLGFCYPATELRLVNGTVLVRILNPQFILSCLFFVLFICKCLYGHGCWWGGGSNVSPRFCGRCLIVKVCPVEVVPMLEIGN